MNMDDADFEAQMGRMRIVVGVQTQVELASFLGVCQSSISDAKRRGKMPANWLVTVIRMRNVNPEWILTGNGPCYLAKQSPIDHYETCQQAQERWEDEAALRRFSSKTLADELLRRIAAK